MEIGDYSRMSRLAAVLSLFDLPEAELHAAKLDGELYAIDQCFSPIDELDGKLNRARALSVTIPARLIAEQRSAAWIYGALPRPPRQHQFCADISARVRPAVLVAITVREVVIEACDLLTFSGLKVTSPMRTVVDLARNSVDLDDADLSVLSELMRVGRFGMAECRTILDRRRNLPNKHVAIERIEHALSRIPRVQTR